MATYTLNTEGVYPKITGNKMVVQVLPTNTGVTKEDMIKIANKILKALKEN